MSIKSKSSINSITRKTLISIPIVVMIIGVIMYADNRADTIEKDVAEFKASFKEQIRSMAEDVKEIKVDVKEIKKVVYRIDDENSSR